MANQYFQMLKAPPVPPSHDTLVAESITTEKNTALYEVAGSPPGGQVNSKSFALSHGLSTGLVIVVMLVVGYFALRGSKRSNKTTKEE